MHELRWSLEAIEDVLAIQRFIAHASPRYALLTAQRLLDAAERLARFPESGRAVPEIGDPAIREVIWRNYRIVHRVSATAVEIVTVFHGARQLPGY